MFLAWVFQYTNFPGTQQVPTRSRKLEIRGEFFCLQEPDEKKEEGKERRRRRDKDDKDKDKDRHSDRSAVSSTTEQIVAIGKVEMMFKREITSCAQFTSGVAVWNVLGLKLNGSRQGKNWLNFLSRALCLLKLPVVTPLSARITCPSFQ